MLGRLPKATRDDLPGFDPQAYLLANPDVAAAASPLRHYSTLGWLEERPVAADFTTRAYLAAQPRARRTLLDIFAAKAERDGRPAPVRSETGRREPGVLIVGYVEANLGLAESSRSLARSLAASNVPFGIYPYNVSVEDRYIGPFMPERYDKHGHYDVTLFEANGDQIPAYLDQFAHRLERSHAILRTYWELGEAPELWRGHVARFDEIWAPTRFVASALRRIFDGPITLVPPGVSVQIERRFPRARFGLDADRFLFCFIFDYSSIAARKNPLGVVAAFQRAFPPGDDAVGLVIKATGRDLQGPETRAALALAASRDPRITLIDETLSRDEVLSLIEICDVYLSLHRSEGFGYGMAEAMALGRPVIGTDYSGSADFLTAETGYPVPYDLRPVLADEYPHGAGQVWAAPDIDAAAAILRKVRENDPERLAKADAGRDLISRRFSAEAVGQVAAKRLGEILATR